jgi:N-acetylmuramoyl-L-alanine amidase
MKNLINLTILSSLAIAMPIQAQESLYIAFPSPNYKTSAGKISFIGSAPPSGEVYINNQLISRSKMGNFAPQFPLNLGENVFTIKYQNQQKIIKIIRETAQITPPKEDFAAGSVLPNQNISRLPNELICLSAIAPNNAQVSVNIGNNNIDLVPQLQQIDLPDNKAALTGTNQAQTAPISKYVGCFTSANPKEYNYPNFQLKLNDSTGKPIIKNQQGTGKISILSPTKLSIAEVINDNAITRTGSTSDYSRLTPLPKGVKSAITGQEGDWLRLDYGGWINKKDVQILPPSIPPQTIIRSIISKELDQVTEVNFPLQIPVPVTIKQSDRQLTLTLYNTIAQTDIIKLNPNPIIKRIDWQQTTPNTVEYVLNLKTDQQWGYKLEYRGTTLVLTVRHQPQKTSNNQPLSGIKILIDPGHGGKESGASSPTGYLEKDVNLTLSKLVAKELINRGANVILTRDKDQEVSLPDRVKMIEQNQPAISVSIHYNSLPDDGDFIKTKGMGAFWYHPQAANLAEFMHNYIVNKLGRKSYGVFWDNLALTRPNIAPSVLLELGFISNPEEFEWVINPQEQQKLAQIIAEGLTSWFNQNLSK